MTNDLPFERGPTSARELVGSETVEDRPRGPDEAALKVCQESMAVSERERVEQLWLPRLYRKISRQLRPEPWQQILADYIEQWCKSTKTWHRRATPFECEWIRDPRREGPEGSIPELDAIRCIVFGWADGIDPEKLQRWVTRWRDELEPAMQWLDPVTSSSLPGPLLYAYVTEELPAVRARLSEIIDSWPDSPPAVQGLLRDFGPTVELVRRLQEQTVPDSAKDALYDEGKGFPYALDAIALGDELAALHRLADRAARVEDLLADAKRSLEEMGWTVGKDGKLQARTGKRGRRARYFGRVIRGLYAYLHPIYRRTFEDTQANPDLLRRHISQLLSPFFSRREISPAPKGKIGNAIDRFVHREGGLQTASR
jgi:hypothetical protein